MHYGGCFWVTMDSLVSRKTHAIRGFMHYYPMHYDNFYCTLLKIISLSNGSARDFPKLLTSAIRSIYRYSGL
jgi:hypothetical protein